MSTPWIAPVLTVLAIIGLVYVAPKGERVWTALWLIGVYAVGTVIWGVTYALGWWQL